MKLQHVTMAYITMEHPCKCGLNLLCEACCETVTFLVMFQVFCLTNVNFLFYYHLLSLLFLIWFWDCYSAFAMYKPDLYESINDFRFTFPVLTKCRQLKIKSASAGISLTIWLYPAHMPFLPNVFDFYIICGTFCTNFRGRCFMGIFFILQLILDTFFVAYTSDTLNHKGDFSGDHDYICTVVGAWSALIETN